MIPHERWDAFLAKIRARHDEIIAEATAGTNEFLDQPEVDLNALARVWTAVRGRLIELWRKIDDTWSDTVGDMFPAGSIRDAAYDKGQGLHRQLDREFERARARAEAVIGRWIVKRAAEMRVTEAQCGRCGSKHSVVGVRFTHEWTCDSCQATATFTPSTFEYQVEGAAGWIAKDRAYEQEQAARKTPQDPAKRRAYWQIALATIAEIMPERAATLEADLARKVAEDPFDPLR